MASTETTAAELEQARISLDGLQSMGRIQYGSEPHQWVTIEAAEAMLSLLFGRYRIIFGILLARYQTGLELRPPSGKRVTDAG